MRGKNPHAMQAFSEPFIDKLRRCHDVTATRNVRRRRCWGRRISRCVSLLHCFWSRVLRYSLLLAVRAAATRVVVAVQPVARVPQATRVRRRALAPAITRAPARMRLAARGQARRRGRRATVRRAMRVPVARPEASLWREPVALPVKRARRAEPRAAAE